MGLSFDFEALKAHIREVKSEQKKLNKIDGKCTKVGVFEDAGYVTGKDILRSELAAMLDMGNSHIPERPYMRRTFDKNLNAIESKSLELHTQYVNGQRDHKSILKELGEWYTEKVTDEILTGTYTANAPSTIAKKGHNTPLIDTTEELLGNIIHKEF